MQAVGARVPGMGLRLTLAVMALAALWGQSSVARSNEDASNTSTAHYDVVILPDIRVRMRDGVELAVRITRPRGPGHFPAVMSSNPYRTLPTLKAASSEREYSNNANAPYYFAEHGYVSVNYDVRGTGASGGSSPDMYADAERQDGYDMVEWIATQPWSNGSVGVWGFSYGGVVAWQIAALAPPHLKAIIVGSGTEDVYHDWTYPGGVPRSFFIYGGYAAWMAAANFAPPDSQLTGEQWSQLWDERLANSVPWSVTFLKHQTDDAYWRARSLRPNYDRVKCAVFVVGGWADWYPTAELRAFTNLTVPKRALIGPWAHAWPENGVPGPRVDARPEYLKWFDQFLKGVDTGVLREPPIILFVDKYQAPTTKYDQQTGFWRQEMEWPLARTRYTSMYPGPHGRLESHSDTSDEAELDSYTYRASVGTTSGILAGAPWEASRDQRQDETYSLTYTAPPLAADLEVTGNPSVDLFVTSSADVAYFVVKMCDVAPDGTSKLVTDGALNATHRISDSRPEPLKPGRIYELKFDLHSMAYVFPAGHRIRVDISSADFQNAWPVSKPAVNSLVRGARFPSHVILPIVPPQVPALTEPVLLASPSIVSDFEPEPPQYNITYDLVNRTTTLSSASEGTQATYTVSDMDPANARIVASAEYVVSRPDGDIKVEARTSTTSDAEVFRHLVQVEVTVNGKQHFSKSWAVSVPRVLN